MNFGGTLANNPTGLIEVLGAATAFAAQGLANNQGSIVLRSGTFDNNGRTMTHNGNISGAGILRTGGLTNSLNRNIGVGAGNMDILGPVHNDGKVNVQAGATVTFYDRVNGSGSYPGPGTVVFLGDFSPGDSPAWVQFGGDAILAPSADLIMEIGGTTPGAEYDVLDVAGQLWLGGTLDVALVYNFQPYFGQTFDLFHWGSLAGQFDGVNLPTLGAGLAWDASLMLDTGAITVVPEPATLSLLSLGAITALLRRKRR